MYRKTSPSVLFVLLIALVMAATAHAATPPFTNTTIVNGNLAPLANGAALLAAVAAANPPELIKVEPGLFDLGNNQLIMRNQVDVEGSGRDLTFIRSGSVIGFVPGTVNVPANVTAELRELTVQHFSNGAGTGVQINSSTFLLTEVNVETRDGGNSIGVHTVNSSPRLNEIFVRVLSQENATGVKITGGGTVVTESFALVASEGPNNIAWEVEERADAVLERVVALAFSGRESNTAVSVHNESNAQLTNVRGTALEGEVAQGLHLFKRSSVEVKESTFKSSSDRFSVAFLLEGAVRSKTTESTFIATPIAQDHLSVFAVRLTGAARLDSNQSNYDGSSFAAQNLGTGQARFGASQLIGSVFSASLTGLQCIFAYNGNYTARNAACI